MPKIFDLHVGIEFLKQTLIVAAVLCTLVSLAQFIDATGNIGATQGSYIDSLIVVAGRTPFILTEITFLAAFIGGILTYGRLTTSAEITVLKSVGYSTWRVAIVGGLTIAVYALVTGPLMSPLSAQAMRFSRAFEAEKFGRQSTISIFSIPPNTRWASINATIDGTPQRLSYRAKSADVALNRLNDVRLDFFLASGAPPEPTNDSGLNFFRWMRAETLTVNGDVSVLEGVTIVDPGEEPRQVARLTLPIAPDVNAYKTGAPAPNTLSLAQLFTNRGELAKSGIRAPVHVLRSQQLLSMPLLAFGSVMMAAVFALRPLRGGRRGLWVTLGFIAGVNLFFVYNLTIALGAQSVQQAQFTVWTVPIGLTLLSTWLLSFLEDS